MKRVLNYILTPIPALALGYGSTVTREILLMARFAVPQPTRLVFSPLSFASIERVPSKIASTNDSWSAKKLDPAYFDNEQLDMALKYELHKKIHGTPPPMTLPPMTRHHCIFCQESMSSAGVVLTLPGWENQLYQVFNKTKSLYGIVFPLSTGFKPVTKLTFETRNPLDKMLLTLPVYDYHVLKNVRQTSKRFHDLIAHYFFSLDQQSD
jgi:hypothetical protein